VSALWPIAVDADDARRVAEDVLRGDRFHDDPAPRPLRGPLEWIGERLRDVFEPVGSALEALPGPTWVAVLALLAAIVALVVWRIARRAERLGTRASEPAVAAAGTHETAAELEAAAARAEREGDRDLALRLRFRAGLLRLDHAGAITFTPALTTREVRASVVSERFDELADDFEAVAYSEHRATELELAAAKRDWQAVVRAAERG
jgi:hypothetical protein